MPNFDKYVSRHGEHGAQALIELIERYEGRRSLIELPLSLEDRWNALMQDLPNSQAFTLAA